MNQVIESLQKVSRIEDQVLVGLSRVSSNVKLAIALITAARQADVGPDSNAVLDELLNVANKLQAIVRAR